MFSDFISSPVCVKHSSISFQSVLYKFNAYSLTKAEISDINMLQFYGIAPGKLA